MGYVIVDVDKLASQCSDDIKVTPDFWRNRTVVDFHQDRVNIVQKLNWKIFKARPLPAFAVDFEGNVFSKEVTARKEIFECIEYELTVLFCAFTNAYRREDVGSLICFANLDLLTRVTITRAVVLIVWHRKISSNQATQRVLPSDTNVDKCLRLLEEIFADYVASVL